MIYKPFSDYEARVRRDLDLIDEPIVSQSQIMGFMNSAISKAEAAIMKLNEDYFRSSDFVTLESGESDYDMPDNIFACKLRGVFYIDGTLTYEVRKIRGQNMFLNIADIQQFGSAMSYQYDIENNSAAEGFRFVLYPPARETSDKLMKRWYIRSANRILVDTDVCDIPEAEEYILNFIKTECAKVAHPDKVPGLEKDTMEANALMIQTLEDKTPDGHDELETDVSFYMEHS